jgi:hypothetical protein
VVHKKIGVFKYQVGACRGVASFFELVLIKPGGWNLIPVGDGESRESLISSGWIL